MAQSSLVAAALLLALIANHIAYSKIVKQLTHSFLYCGVTATGYCENAKYQKSNLAVFTKACSPKSWEAFFQDEYVVEALGDADLLSHDPVKEMIALQNLGNKVLRYHIEPPMQLMFEAFKRVSPKDIKVVILGQDPTPQEGKATGRAFSVENPRTVGSVLNVLLEVALEGWSVDLSKGDLSKWENQGVLLLNSALTIGEIEYIDVKDGKTKRQLVSHLGYWRPFTKLLIEHISNVLPEPSVWMLWGNVAQYFTPSISTPKNYILTGGHPSPLGGASGMNTFFAGNYFYCANEFLRKKRNVMIDWGLVVHNQRADVRSQFDQCPQF